MPETSCSVADRELNRDAAVGELGPNSVEHAEEIGALAIEHVHEDHARELVLVGALPHARSAHLDAHDGGQNDERAFDDAERGEGIRLEARIARAVDRG